MPIRIGGLDQIAANWPGSSVAAGSTQRTLPSPARAALAAHRSSARSLTSTAQIVASGARDAMASAMGPYPVPRSSRSPPGRRDGFQQHPAAGVQPARGEHPGVRGALEVQVGEDNLDQARAVRSRRARREVMLARLFWACLFWARLFWARLFWGRLILAHRFRGFAISGWAVS